MPLWGEGIRTASKSSAEGADEVVFAFLENLGEPFAIITLPKDLGSFLEKNFASIDKDINLLYKSLDDFRDSVTNWVQKEQGVTEAEKAKDALAKLNDAAKII